MSSSVIFILGFLTGAISIYLGNRYTDMWRKLEIRKQTRKQFKEIKEKMPALVVAMKADLCKEKFQFVRVFALLGKEWPLPDLGEEYHEGLQGNITVLENLGYVKDIALTSIKKYRMTEEFIKIVCDTNMIMSYLSTIEMSYRKVVIIPGFSGGYYGVRGHNHVKAKRSCKIARCTEDPKQGVKA